MPEERSDEMRGVLFKNAGKKERQPDWRGHVTVNGQKYSLAAWERQSKNGAEYLSLAVSEWREGP